MESLNDYIIEHLKKGKYEKTLKLFEEKNGGPTKENSKICEKFINYLNEKETEKENEIDDLGFEINFGAFKPEPKVSFFTDLSNYGPQIATCNVRCIFIVFSLLASNIRR